MRAISENGNKIRLNLGLGMGMGMNHWEWEKEIPAHLCCRHLLYRIITTTGSHRGTTSISFILIAQHRYLSTGVLDRVVLDSSIPKSGSQKICVNFYQFYKYR